MYFRNDQWFHRWHSVAGDVFEGRLPYALRRNTRPRLLTSLLFVGAFMLFPVMCERTVKCILSRGVGWRISIPRSSEFHDGKIEAVGKQGRVLAVVGGGAAGYVHDRLLRSKEKNFGVPMTVKIPFVWEALRGHLRTQAATRQEGALAKAFSPPVRVTVASGKRFS
jgi:hypothetical protein